ncbi:MAG TPA: single-stranded-DNA-specific exonuclease RecJ [Bryobacteraceae bacterium]|nr:single-stranded-DNA-specific exonuclease RecJ [Bryobacteraceae bacterium]
MKWILTQGEPADAAVLSAALGISLPAARVLCARGLSDPAAARRFLAPSAADLHDPFLLADMKKAAARLAQAIERKEPILLYGDYDVDGTSALVVLKKVLDLAGANTACFVPHRIRDGYGMKSEAVEDAAALGVKLIVSVDTGIRANQVVKHAAGLGIDVIVTDHHLPEAELPPALAVLNPNRRDCTYPEKNLCGAGVALKLAEALMISLGWERARRERLVDSLLKLVAIATVADVVPLTGENRVIVKRGLDGLDRVTNLGLRALLDVAGIEPGTAPSARQVAFQIAPRINAAGRMASASDIIELFSTSDPQRARAIAAQLDELNKDRRETEDGIRQAILEQCLAQPVTDSDAALVFAGEGWHRGVVGIVASRVVERYHRPVFVLGLDKGMAYGSGRSIRAFHLLDALEAMPALFQKFGGHRQAAGVTLLASQVDEFRVQFQSYAATRLTVADFEAEIEIDAEISFDEITDRTIAELLNLAPFGFGNPPPTLLARGVEVAAPPDIKNDKHVFLRLKSQGRTLRAKAWNFAERADEFAPSTRIDVALQFEDDAYSAKRGYAPWQTIVRDVRPADYGLRFRAEAM